MLCGACWHETTSETLCSACGAAPLLDGRYRLDAKLGQGASGIAFAATRVADGVRVCVKGLSFRGMSSFDAEKLFRREATVLRQIRHAQVPAYVDDFTLGAGPSFTLYLVQELVVGHDLENERRERRPTTREVCAIADEILSIVEHLHDLAPPIVHRDIKLRNVMRREDGKLVLVDFGAVKEVVHVSFDPGMSVQGTFGYMAPEQLRGEASPKSDLYAIGMVAVALFSGLEPSAMMRSANAAHSVDWEPHVAVAEPLKRWLRKMTAIDPVDRYRDAPAARAALAEALAARDAPEPRPEPRPAPRREPALPIFRDEEPPSVAEPPTHKSVGGVLGLGIALTLAVLVLVAVSGKKKSDYGAAQSFSAAKSPELECGGACRPLSVPFKDTLRFGMGIDEARAARPDVATAADPDDRDPMRLVGKSYRWMPQGVSEVPMTRLCMDSELVGKEGSCCLDFFGDPRQLGRLACATTYGYENAVLESLAGKVGQIYGRPDESSFEDSSSILSILSRPTRWTSNKEATLTIEFDWAQGEPSVGDGFSGGITQRMVMTQTSAAFQAALDDVDRKQEAARQAAAAAAEAERRREIERAREERKKLGLPPEPL